MSDEIPCPECGTDMISWSFTPTEFKCSECKKIYVLTEKPE